MNRTASQSEFFPADSEITATPGRSANHRDGPGFTKHATDEISSTSYMQQRHFDFDGMRFLSPDPVGIGADNFNRYAYANNNPYRFVDPDGRQALDQSAKFIDLNRRHGSDPGSMSAEMSTGHMQGATVAAGGLAMAPALAFVGTTAAAVLTDAAAGTWMGAIAVNGPAIVASTEIVAGTAAAVATGGGAPSPTAGGGILVRFGKGPETLESLSSQAAKAEAHAFPHGVSTRLRDRALASDMANHRCASKCDVERIFPVQQSGADPRHHTVTLPKPVTQETVDSFNGLFER